MRHIIRRSDRKWLGISVTVIGLVVMWVLWGGDAPQADSNLPLSRTTAMFGVAPGQTARAGIVNVKGAAGISIVGVRFFNAKGEIVHECYERVPQELRMRQAFFCDGPAPDSDPLRDRTEIRAVFALFGKPTDFVASVQIFDTADGRTAFTERFLPEGNLVTHVYFTGGIPDVVRFDAGR